MPRRRDQTMAKVRRSIKPSPASSWGPRLSAACFPDISLGFGTLNLPEKTPSA
jgi:hypothetical protein